MDFFRLLMTIFRIMVKYYGICSQIH